MLQRQLPAGSFPASPDFSQYGFCWLRDGSFIAHALDQAGEHDAAARFHCWSAMAIDGASEVLERALAAQAAGKPLDPVSMPPARFGLDGHVVDDDWPNYQVDGYGTWLWGLGAHLASRDRALPKSWLPAVSLTARYLDAFAFEPCFNVWEESSVGSAVHTSTLACVWAGLVAAGRLLGEPVYERRAAQVAEQVRHSADSRGWFPESTSRIDVDASTVWLSAPLGMVSAQDPLMAATVAEIERSLMLEGGVRRFSGDTYFGGGSWPVLTCSLGLHYVRAGRVEDARRCLAWTLDRVSPGGQLAEQFFGEHRDPEHYKEWVDRWGPPAAELLWSHAMLVLLALELGRSQAPTSRLPSNSSPSDPH